MTTTPPDRPNLKPLAVLLIVAPLFLLLVCAGLAEGPFRLAYLIVAGWWGYLARVVPATRVSWAGVASAAACLAGVLWLGHATARWLWAGTATGDGSAPTRPPWRFRTTLAGVAVIVMMFVSGIAAVGVTHQTAWLVTSDEPIFKSRGEAANRRRCAANIQTIYKACYLYAVNHGDRFPESLEQLVSAGDVVDLGIFACPSANAEPPPADSPRAAWSSDLGAGQCSYVYRGRGLTVATATPDTPIVCEPLVNHNGTGMHIVFGDGHVDWFPAEKAMEIMKAGR